MYPGPRYNDGMYIVHVGEKGKDPTTPPPPPPESCFSIVSNSSEDMEAARGGQPLYISDKLLLDMAVNSVSILYIILLF